MATSSMHTAVTALLSRRIFEKGTKWFIGSTMAAAHSHAKPVQARVSEWNEDLLLRAVQSEVDEKDQALLWLSMATGNRDADVERLYPDQITFEKNFVEVDWWLRKRQRKPAQKKKGQRYEYDWSCKPSQSTLAYFKRAPKTTTIFAGEAKYSLKRIANHVTALLRKTNPDWTSYIFRDRMDEILRAEGKTSEEVKALLDHTGQTGSANYQKTSSCKKVTATARATTAAKKRAIKTTKAKANRAKKGK